MHDKPREELTRTTSCSGLGMHVVAADVFIAIPVLVAPQSMVGGLGLALRTESEIGAPIGALVHPRPTGVAYSAATDVDRVWMHVVVGAAGKDPVLRAFRVGTGGVNPVGVANSVGRAAVSDAILGQVVMPEGLSVSSATGVSR